VSSCNTARQTTGPGICGDESASATSPAFDVWGLPTIDMSADEIVVPFVRTMANGAPSAGTWREPRRADSDAAPSLPPATCQLALIALFDSVSACCDCDAETSGKIIPGVFAMTTAVRRATMMPMNLRTM
jgi:hypothetical protein